jgi:hypothetical protein
MAKDDQQEAFEKVLSSTLVRVLDFLKFAEAKNAALLTLASAWIIGSINILTGSNSLSPDWRLAFVAALPPLAVGAVLALISFLPKTYLPKFHEDPNQSKSLLYFGDAASFAPAAYQQRVRERYYPPKGETATSNYLDDLSIQIAVNSRIVTRKLSFFNAGALCVLVALLLLFLTPAVRACWFFVASRIGSV